MLGVSHDVTALDSRDLDIGDPEAVRAALTRYRPKVVINCAAYTRVDACEGERDRALRVNTTGPRNLAQALAESGGRLVHLSTDYVFDGLRPAPAPYTEEDPPEPLSCYGATKRIGELAIQETGQGYLIVRTAWLYGAHGANFLKTILRLALRPAGRPLRVVDDQYGSPTWSARLARQLKVLVEAGAQGIYHAGAQGWCTWYELALFFLQHMGVEAQLAPCSSAEYPTAAARPSNSILENRRLKEEGLNVMRPWAEDVAEFVEKYREALLQEARK